MTTLAEQIGCVPGLGRSIAAIRNNLRAVGLVQDFENLLETWELANRSGDLRTLPTAVGRFLDKLIPGLARVHPDSPQELDCEIDYQLLRFAVQGLLSDADEAAGKLLTHVSLPRESMEEKIASIGRVVHQTNCRS